ncbi:MAG: hypothetical protein ACTSPR_08115 [Candidatus Thorarchaeota archaeon]
MDGNKNLELNQALEHLQAGDSEGSLFFKRPGKAWPLFGSTLALALFPLWVLHTGLDGVMVPILVGLYMLIVLASMKAYFVDIRFLDSEEHIHFHYERPAAVWPLLVDAQLGASIVCASLWFILLNAFPHNPEIALTIPFLALLINVLLVPVVPLMASDSSISVFKTSVHVVLSKDGNVIAQPTLNAHPLELRWVQKSEDEEFLLSIAERVLDLFSTAV